MRPRLARHVHEQTAHLSEGELHRLAARLERMVREDAAETSDRQPERD